MVPAMDLKTWLENEGYGAQQRLSKETDLAYTTIFHIANGRPCRPETARLISKATGGAVSPEELALGRPDIVSARRRRITRETAAKERKRSRVRR